MYKLLPSLLFAMAQAMLPIAGGTAQAAEIEIAPPITQALYSPYPLVSESGTRLSGDWVDLSGYRHVRLTGEIVPGDAARLREVLASIDPSRFGDTIVSLSSPGGSFAEALEIGDMLADGGIGTFVGDGDICLSACAFAFLAGRRMIVRNILWEPWRHLHRGGTLGFHSPSLPGGVPRDVIAAVGEDVLFAEIAAPTLETVRELQSRSERWTISSGLLFEILGRVGADAFFFVERLEETTTNDIVVVGPAPPAYTGFGLVEARIACEMVVRERWRDTSGSIHAAGINGTFPHARFFDIVFDTVEADMSDLGQAAFRFDMFLLGQGNTTCHAAWEQGRFLVTFDRAYFGDGPWVETVPSRDDLFVVSVHPHATIGYGLPWREVGGEDLFIEAREELFARWPEGYREAADAYDFCAPRNPETWAVICRFATVHDAVRLLTAVAETHRDHPEAATLYARWAEDAGRFCMPGGIQAGDTLRETMMGYCALAVTQRQLARAAELWLAAE